MNDLAIWSLDRLETISTNCEGEPRSEMKTYFFTMIELNDEIGCAALNFAHLVLSDFFYVLLNCPNRSSLVIPKLERRRALLHPKHCRVILTLCPPTVYCSRG